MSLIPISPGNTEVGVITDAAADVDPKLNQSPVPTHYKLVGKLVAAQLENP